MSCWNGCSLASHRARTAGHRSGSAVGRDRRTVDESAVPHVSAPHRDLLSKLVCRLFADLRQAVIILDGIELVGRSDIVALGIATERDKLAFAPATHGREHRKVGCW